MLLVLVYCSIATRIRLLLRRSSYSAVLYILPILECGLKLARQLLSSTSHKFNLSIHFRRVALQYCTSHTVNLRVLA
jgi:hypothetical protein